MKMREFETIVRDAVEEYVEHVEFDNGKTYNAVDVLLTDGETKDTFFVDVHVSVKKIEFYGKIWNPEGTDYEYGTHTVKNTTFRMSQSYDMDSVDIEDAVRETAIKAVKAFMARFTKE